VSGKIQLFVYGTLKRGCRNHSRLRAAAFLGEAWTAPGYTLVDCGSYPGLVRAEGSEGVCGELYQFDTSLLAALDAFEDAPGEYLRVSIQLKDGGEAQTYLYREEAGHLNVYGPEWHEE